ncbi:hypothetical protein LSAT2_000371 [Lamellibrachia satsuma]|nr:hypothetical protein LSAT2_000371 [Lamellibrachia satsuma]
MSIVGHFLESRTNYQVIASGGWAFLQVSIMLNARRRGMEEDCMSSNNTNMYLSSGLLLSSTVASTFRGADVVAIADVETRAPLVLGVFQQLPTNPAGDYRDAALVIDRGFHFDVVHRCVVACTTRTDDLKILFKDTTFNAEDMNTYIINLLNKFEMALIWNS